MQDAAPTSLVQDIPLDLIFPDPAQVRREFDEEAMAQLAESIRAHGVIQPIVVRPIDATAVAPYEIIAGERRWRASKLAGTATIPAVIRADLIGQDVSVLQILENLQRQDLSLQETANGVAKLVKAIGNAKAAEQLGKSEAWISKHARIEALPDDVRQLVTDGHLSSADMAHDIAQLKKLAPRDYWTQQAFARAADGTLLRADLRDWIQSAQRRADMDKKREEQLALQNSQAQMIAGDEDDDEDGQPGDANESPEWRAQQQAQKEREKEREKRRAAIDKLRASCEALGTGWVTTLEQQLGVKCLRDAESGEVIFGEYLDGSDDSSLGIAVHLPRVFSDEPVPKTPEHVTFEVQMILDHRQMMTLLQSLAGESASHEKQGQLCVSQFMQACVVRDAKAKVKAADVHAAYVKFCRKAKLDPIAFNDNAWGDAIAAAGIEKRRSNGIQYIGIKLK